MRRLVYFLIIIALIALSVRLCYEPIITRIAGARIQATFSGSSVNVGGCVVRPAREVRLTDVEIKRGDDYLFKAGEIGLSYNILRLIKTRSADIYVNNAVIDINLPNQNITELKDSLGITPGTGGFVQISKLKLSNIDINAKLRRFSFQCGLSADLDLEKKLLDYLDLRIPALKGRGFYLKEFNVAAGKGLPKGSFHIGLLKYDKFEIRQIAGASRLENNRLFVDSIAASLFGGEIKGNMSFMIDKDSKSLADLRISNMDIDTFVRRAELENRFTMSGKLSGEVSMATIGSRISDIKGDLFTAQPGGVLVITDGKFLEDMAKRTKQPVEILVGSFKEYRYNIGKINLSLDGKNLIVNINLDGESGKRDLNIILHDFIVKKEMIR